MFNLLNISGVLFSRLFTYTVLMWDSLDILLKNRPTASLDILVYGNDLLKWPLPMSYTILHIALRASDYNVSIYYNVIKNLFLFKHLKNRHYTHILSNCTGHLQNGSLAGVAHLLECNTGVPRTAPWEQKPLIEYKGKSCLNLSTFSNGTHGMSSTRF